MKFLFALILLCTLSLHTQGQEKVWKKRVSRTIDIRDVQGTGKSTHSTLSGILINSVKSGKITAYTAFDNSFTTIMTPKEFTIHCEQIDTVIGFDPITDSLVAKVVDKSVLPDSVYKYRLFEEWVFDPLLGKLTIQIKYVAPIQQMYGSDGEFRGRVPFFWISYHNFSSAMEVNDIKQIQPFYRYLWQSYFDNGALTSDDYFNTKTGLWFGNAIAAIDMSEPDDTINRFFRNENNDTLLSEQIVNDVRAEIIPGWIDYDDLLSPRITKEQVTKILAPRYDTMIETEGGIDTIITAHDLDYARIHKYMLLQHWTFNSITGKTEIGMRNVAPVLDIYNDASILQMQFPIFWIRYADLQPILNKVEQYHPTNTFAMHVWDNFFLLDKKPELQK